MAKHCKLENASPSKLKGCGLSRRVQGRLQIMLSLPLGILFVESLHHPGLLYPKFDLPLNILSTAAYGSPEPHTLARARPCSKF
jgi:hypothetical protein